MYTSEDRSRIQSLESLIEWKGIHPTRNPHPIYNFLSYVHLSSSFCAFISSLSSVPIPKTTAEALFRQGWSQAMIKEIVCIT